MKTVHYCTFVILITILSSIAKAQGKAIIGAPPEKRLPALWQYCATEYISNGDSLPVNNFLNDIIQKADSLRDTRLKAYAQYFKRCWRILFTKIYAKQFTEGDQDAVYTLYNTQCWALRNKYPDIAASCDYNIGQIYYRTAHYGLAFEYLLKADDAFRQIGYQRVPNAAQYLYFLGLYFYRFEEYDKALENFLQAINYDFYLPHEDINALNTIGLIFAQKKETSKAILFFRNTIDKARQYGDTAWIGIGLGNLGNVLIAEHKADSALVYHRQNYTINTSYHSNALHPGAGKVIWAPEDAAKSALSMASVFLGKKMLDSALYYMHAGEQLASRYILDSTESLYFRRRLLRVKIDYLKVKNDFAPALLLTDSLSWVERELKSRLDSKILNRAIEKAEAISYKSRLSLLESQKDIVQFRAYFIIAILLMVVVLAVFIFRDKWLRKKRQMILAEKDKQILLEEKRRVEDGLRYSKQLMEAYIDTIKEKTTLIEHLNAELKDLKRSAPGSRELHSIASNQEKLMESTILTNDDWLRFKKLFDQVHPGFSYRLKLIYPDLSPAESRFVFLAKLTLSTKDMATMLGISVHAIHKLRYRLRKKLNLDEDSNFEGVIKKIDNSIVASGTKDAGQVAESEKQEL